MKMKNFTQIPNELISNKDINDGAFRTYTVLKSFKYHKNKVFPSQATLAHIRDKTQRTIINHLKLLKRLKIIDYKKRGYSASNIYSFISESNFINSEQNREKDNTTKMKISSPLKCNNFPLNNTKANNIKTNKGIEILRKKIKDLALKKSI